VELLHRALLTASACVVYYDHRPVLRHAGYGLATFVRDCRATYRMEMRIGVYRPRLRDSAGRPAS
jgi:hypothetical protein